MGRNIKILNKKQGCVLNKTGNTKNASQTNVNSRAVVGSHTNTSVFTSGEHLVCICGQR